MKKLILFLLLTVAGYGQVSTGTETYFDYGIQVAPASLQVPTTVNWIGTVGTDGTQGRVLPQNITIPQIPLNYSVLTPTIGGHLSGIDIAIGDKALDSNVIHKTGDETKTGKLTVATGTAATTSISSQGSGTFSMSNNGSGVTIPVLSSKSDTSVGMYLIGATADTHAGSTDFQINVRKTDNSDFTTLTSTAFKFSRFNTTLIDVLRNGNTSFTGNISAPLFTGGATLTGNPTAPTPTAGDNDTSIATTAFVNTASNWTKTVNDIRNNNTGNVEIKPSGAMSVLNSSNVEVARIDIGGNFKTSVVNAGFFTSDGSSGMYQRNSNETVFRNYQNGFLFEPIYLNFSAVGTYNTIGFKNQTVNPTSGSAIFNFFNSSPIINQTGGANGITRSIYINPTLTSAFDYRAIEVTNGNSLFYRVIMNNVLRLKNYTVATLPAGTQGDTAYVTDALAPTYLVTVVGGGAVVTPVFYNGTAWVSH